MKILRGCKSLPFLFFFFLTVNFVFSSDEKKKRNRAHRVHVYVFGYPQFPSKNRLKKICERNKACRNETCTKFCSKICTEEPFNWGGGKIKAFQKCKECVREQEQTNGCANIVEEISSENSLNFAPNSQPSLSPKLAPAMSLGQGSKLAPSYESSLARSNPFDSSRTPSLSPTAPLEPVDEWTNSDWKEYVMPCAGYGTPCMIRNCAKGKFCYPEAPIAHQKYCKGVLGVCEEHWDAEREVQKHCGASDLSLDIWPCIDACRPAETCWWATTGSKREAEECFHFAICTRAWCLLFGASYEDNDSRCNSIVNKPSKRALRNVQ